MLLLSTEKLVGLHWVLGFMPFVLATAGAVLAAPRRRAALKWTAWLSLPHLLLLAVLAHAPLSLWSKYKFHDDLAFLFDAQQIAAALHKDLPKDAVIMSMAYSPGVILAYHAREYVPVFGTGRFHARQEDVLVDFRKFDGKPVRIFSRGNDVLNYARP